jgi:hypothetical protein
MKAIYIYPNDIGASGEWSEDWIKFITKLGYNKEESVWSYALIINIETTS